MFVCGGLSVYECSQTMFQVLPPLTAFHNVTSKTFENKRGYSRGRLAHRDNLHFVKFAFNRLGFNLAVCREFVPSDQIFTSMSSFDSTKKRLLLLSERAYSLNKMFLKWLSDVIYPCYANNARKISHAT